MRKIGSGLQYEVFDCGNGRVYKKKTGRIRKVLTLISWGYVWPRTILETMGDAESVAEASLKRLRTKLCEIDAAIIGNPEILDNLDYFQDKTMAIGEYFSQNSFETNKAIVDAYIENIFQTWRYGFSDTVFNFTLNNGVRKNGSVVLLDVGELTFDKNAVRELIISQKWRGQYSFRYLSVFNSKIGRYALSSMNSRVNLRALEESWGVMSTQTV